MKENKRVKTLYMIFTIIGICILVGAVKVLTDFIQFKRNGIETEAVITAIDVHIGGTTMIYYNLDNPNQIRTSSNFLLGIMFVLGIVFFTVGFSMLLCSQKKVKNKKKLVEYGTKIYANFVKVRKNIHFSYNGRNPYQIVCQSDNQAVIEYVSENLWSNPENIIKERNITAFPVYLDPENSKKYYLSTEEIEEYITLK